MANLNSWKNSIYTVYGITAIFFLLSFLGVINHELWLDEAHHYLLARDSISFQNLLKNTRYEGHPILWNLILYLITRLTTDPIWMQIFHIGIMTIAVGVFLKKAPFSWKFKLLFIFGYFMFYEYNILSRNYSLGVFFIFLACSLYDKRDIKYLLISALLGFASNSHAIFLILASSIMGMIILERFKTRKLRFSKSTWIGIGIFGVLTFISFLQIIPPSDTSFFDRGEDISFFQKIAKSLSPFFKSIFIIPDVTIDSFWNSNILINYNKSIATLFALISLCIPYLLFYKNKKLLIYIYFGILATAGFFFITMMNAARYYGILYLFLITALWFDAYTSPKVKKSTLFSENTLKQTRNIIIYSILGIHFVSGAYTYTKEIREPFTTAKQTAKYLKEKNLIEKTIVTKACNGTTLSAYIEKPIYFTKTNSFQSYCTFNRPSTENEQTTLEVIRSIRNLLKTNKEPIIFITYEAFLNPIEKKPFIIYNQDLKIKFLAKFEGSIIKKGNHYLYEISEY